MGGGPPGAPAPAFGPLAPMPTPKRDRAAIATRTTAMTIAPMMKGRRRDRGR
jgi:hypothetical protein